MSQTLFLKVERVRRLHKARLTDVTVHRGADGSFGIGLSDDNAVTNFHHATNEGLLLLGDQVRQVEGVPLVREPLSAVMAREFAERQQVQLQVSRPDGPATSCTGEVFAVLELLRPNGDVLLEFASDLWTLRTDWVWGAFWSMLLPPATAAVRFCVHRSLIFTEPLLGCVDLRIDELPPEALCTRWHALRAKDAGRANAIVGEVLLSVRRYRAASSVSPAAHVPTGLEDDDDDDAFGMLHIGPPQHAAAAIAPVEEPLFDVRVKG